MSSGVTSGWFPVLPRRSEDSGLASRESQGWWDTRLWWWLKLHVLLVQGTNLEHGLFSAMCYGPSSNGSAMEEQVEEATHWDDFCGNSVRGTRALCLLVQKIATAIAKSLPSSPFAFHNDKPGLTDLHQFHNAWVNGWLPPHVNSPLVQKS